MADLKFEGFIDEPGRANGTVAVVSVVLAIIFSIVFYIIFSTKQSALATAEKKLSQSQSQIAGMGEIALQGQAFSGGRSAYTQAIASQTDWKTFWNEIIKTQIRGVFYTSISIDEGSTVRIDAVAPSMVFLAKQLKSIENSPAFNKIDLLSTSKDADRVKFSFNFSFDESKLGQGVK